MCIFVETTVDDVNITKGKNHDEGAADQRQFYRPPIL